MSLKTNKTKSLCDADYVRKYENSLIMHVVPNAGHKIFGCCLLDAGTSASILHLEVLLRRLSTG